MALETKESINSKLFSATKNNQLPVNATHIEYPNQWDGRAPEDNEEI